jgi:ABC-type phosphate transport system auxiliary subunit
MHTGQEIIDRLRTQLGHYRAMKLAVDRQTSFIQVRDVGGLTAGASEVRGLMRKIRDLDVSLRPLRQSWRSKAVDRASSEQQEIETLISTIRERIEAIQAVRDRNEALLKDALGKAQTEMNGLRSQSRAARASQNRTARRPARFLDKSH